jgi:hypothetical protein
MESGDSFSAVENIDLWGYFELLRYQKNRDDKEEKTANLEKALKILG